MRHHYRRMNHFEQPATNQCDTQTDNTVGFDHQLPRYAFHK